MYLKKINTKSNQSNQSNRFVRFDTSTTITPIPFALALGKFNVLAGVLSLLMAHVVLAQTAPTAQPTIAVEPSQIPAQAQTITPSNTPITTSPEAILGLTPSNNPALGLDPTTPDEPKLALPTAPEPTSAELEELRHSLWERIRQGFAMPNLETQLAADKTTWYAKQPEYIARMTDRSGQYLFHIVEELERRGMPTEIALLPFIESAFNPQAMSSAKAAGIWQFMPATGKNFNLKQNVWRDERRSVVESTRAALDYLQKLHGMFGDWHLALAAYNWGEGSVQRAINKNRAKGLGTDYLSLNMPSETANYVPKLQAVKNIIQNPQSYGIRLTPLANEPYFASVIKDRDIDVSLAAQLAGLSLKEFKSLNPSFKKPVILGANHPEILLPASKLALFNEALSNYKGALSSWTTVTLSGTEKPGAFARRYGINEKLLREVNNIPPRMLIKSGSTLVVPKHNLEAQTDNIAAHLENAHLNLAPELVKRSLVAHKRDTWAILAKRAGVSMAALHGWNHGLKKIKKGVSVVYYTSALTAPANEAPALEVVNEPIVVKGQSKHLIKTKKTKTSVRTGLLPKANQSNKSTKSNKSNKSTKSNNNKSTKTKPSTPTKAKKHHR